MPGSQCRRQCLDARQTGTHLFRLNVQQCEISKDFNRKAYLNVLDLFHICLESLSDSETYFGFVVEGFFELVHTIKSLCSRHLIYIINSLEYLLFDLRVKTLAEFGRKYLCNSPESIRRLFGITKRLKKN